MSTWIFLCSINSVFLYQNVVKSDRFINHKHQESKKIVIIVFAQYLIIYLLNLTKI